MIVRTYGRRKPGVNIPRTYSDSNLNDAVLDNDDEDEEINPFRLSFSQDPTPSSSSSQFDFNNFSSSQDSTFENLKRKPSTTRNDVVSLRPKKTRKMMMTTSTLMEAQEFGEMMEHVDEVNFALDGLRRGQPVRIRRASLLALLGICGTAQQRRLLRTQGMAKTIIDAILGLSFDDSPSDLAAATIFYLLTSDGQDDHLLESPSCINFLIRFCKPIVSNTTEDKVPKIGRKLLALRLGADILDSAPKRLDSSSAAILSKVHEILVACKELKPSCPDDAEMSKPELSPKWIALLTMEKACLSTISLEEATGTVRKAGGNFKEKLRELGGLDAVFEVSLRCHFDMETRLKGSSTSSLEKENDVVGDLVLLLKCMKIMENATFLSKENQSHLLAMKGKLDRMEKTLSFTELVIRTISILSGIYLHKSSSSASDDGKSDNLCNGNGHAPEKSSAICQNSQLVYVSSSETTSTSMTETYSLKTRLSSSRCGSYGGTENHSKGGAFTFSYGSRKDAGRTQRYNISKDSKVNLSQESQDPFSFGNDLSEDAVLSQRSYVSEDSIVDLSQESQDPFAFDDDDAEPSKWDILTGKKKIPRSRKKVEAYREVDDGCQLQHIMSQAESSYGEGHDMPESSNSSSVSKERSNLLADCLLTAVKVLMNLANENPVGCQQIAACGGLETMSSLIANHFPSFSSPFSERNENTSSIELDHENGRHLTDQELDFLVAILGLLVNLIEKDGRNRSRLAAVSVQLPSSEGCVEENHKDLILLICSIFLANQGSGEGTEEGKVLPNDEAAVLQGEQEAEKMIVEAYAALLLAFLSTESKGVREAIADCLPDHNLGILVPVLDRFVAFHLTLNMISPETHKVVSEVIESCRIR